MPHTMLRVVWVLLLASCATPPSAPTGPPRQLVIVAVSDVGGSRMPPRGYHQPGYRISETAATALAGLEHDYGLTKVDGWPIDLLDVYCAVMAIDPPGGTDEALARMNTDPRVRLAQPMNSFNVHGEYDDPYFTLQYGASSRELFQMHQNATGRGIHVAIIDTGVDRTHPDLKGRIGISRNFVTADAHFDSDIHGTAVAGIVAANANDGVGIVGLAPEADLLALKACWQDSLDDIRAQCNTFTLAKALTFALEQRVDIINMSLGGPNDPLLALLVELALARGIVVVAAEDAPGEFPADLPGVIAVHAASLSDRPSPTADPNADVIQVAAKELLSTSPGGHYDYFSGSSMGAARVAGLSALLRQQRGNLSPAQMLSALDQQLTALGAHATTADGQFVTHAPNPSRARTAEGT